MKTACFTGHRPRDLRGYVGHEAYEPLVGAIERVCERLVDEFGVTDFVSGGAQGVDQLAFWAVNRLKARRPGAGIRNVVFQPFPGQEDRWREDGIFGRAEYRLMLRLADEVRVVSEDALDDRERVSALFQRNHAMVNASDVVVACRLSSKGDYMTSRGGTAECMRYARRAGKPMVVLEPSTGSADWGGVGA